MTLIRELLELSTPIEELEEATMIDDASMLEINSMLDAAKRGIGLVNKLRDKAQRKKHASAVLTNMNKLRTMLIKQFADLVNVQDVEK